MPRMHEKRLSKRISELELHLRCSDCASKRTHIKPDESEVQPISNLCRMTRQIGKVVKWFDAVSAAGGANVADFIWPGHPDLVVSKGELRAMIWGFSQVPKSRSTNEPLKPRPVNNARTDKLDSLFWK